MAIPVSVQHLFDNLQDVQETPPRPGVITLPDWSDIKLDELARTIKVSVSVKELGLYKYMLYHFYNFYFNGILPPGQSPHNIVYFFLSSLAYGTGDQRAYFLDNIHFENTGFFTLPPPIQNIPPIADTRAALAGQHIPAGLRAEQRAELEALYFVPTNPDKATFLAAINLLIENFNTGLMTQENLTLLKLTGFLSLLLFRGISKEAVQLSRGVNKKLIKNHIHNLASWPIANSYCPPCKTCVDNCSLDFNKGNAHASKMMTLLLASWKRVTVTKTETHGLLPQMQAALLTHTAGNGLGLVVMLYNACESLGVTIRTLMRHTVTEQSNPSWTILSEFLKKYLDRTRPEHTYLWARLISDGYFTEYAARSHPYLAGMFAGIIGSKQTVGSIKEAAWFMQKQHQAEQGYAWGTAVVAKLAQTIDIPLMQEGVEVSNYITRRLPPPGEAPQLQEEEIDPFAAVPIENNN